MNLPVRQPPVILMLKSIVKMNMKELIKLAERIIKIEEPGKELDDLC